MDLNFLISYALNNADVLPGMRTDSTRLLARTDIQSSFGSHQGHWRGNMNLVTGDLNPVPLLEPDVVSVPESSKIALLSTLLFVLSFM